MIRRFIFIFFVTGLSSSANSASVINVDLIHMDQAQDNTGSPDPSSENHSYQSDSWPYTFQKKNEPISVQQSYADKYRIPATSQAAVDDLSRAGFSENSLFGEDQQQSDDIANVLDDIKTSIKDINAEWNGIENWATLFLEDLGINNSAQLVSEQTNLLANTEPQTISVSSQIDKLNSLNRSLDETRAQQQFEDQPFLFQLLFFFSLPHLSRLLSEHYSSLIGIFVLWLIIKIAIKFVRWKMKKKKRRRIKKNRTIDGISKL
jgi:hypothetical protein